MKVILFFLLVLSFWVNSLYACFLGIDCHHSAPIKPQPPINVTVTNNIKVSNDSNKSIYVGCAGLGAFMTSLQIGGKGILPFGANVYSDYLAKLSMYKEEYAAVYKLKKVNTTWPKPPVFSDQNLKPHASTDNTCTLSDSFSGNNNPTVLVPSGGSASFKMTIHMYITLPNGFMSIGNPSVGGNFGFGLINIATQAGITEFPITYAYLYNFDMLEHDVSILTFGKYFSTKPFTQFAVVGNLSGNYTIPNAIYNPTNQSGWRVHGPATACVGNESFKWNTNSGTSPLPNQFATYEKAPTVPVNQTNTYTLTVNNCPKKGA